jgi:hypothetical protein
MLVKNAGFATSLPSTIFQTCPPSLWRGCPPLQSFRRGGRVCGDVEAVGFPVQNAYKIAEGDKNTTFEPLNL